MNKLIYKVLKIIRLIIYSLIRIAFVLGCDVNNADDPDVVIVPFEMVIPVNQMSDGTWNVSNGLFWDAEEFNHDIGSET